MRQSEDYAFPPVGHDSQNSDGGEELPVFTTGAFSGSGALVLARSRSPPATPAPLSTGRGGSILREGRGSTASGSRTGSVAPSVGSASKPPA